MFPWGVNLKFHHDAIQKSVLWPTIVTGREKAAVSYTFNSILGVFTRKNRFIFFLGGGVLMSCYVDLKPNAVVTPQDLTAGTQMNR